MVRGSLTLSAMGVTLVGHLSLGLELHCPGPPRVASTHRTKLSSELSNLQPLPEALLLMLLFTQFPKQVVSLAPSLLLHRLSLSILSLPRPRNQCPPTRVALDFPPSQRLRFLWSLKVSPRDADRPLGT